MSEPIKNTNALVNIEKAEINFGATFSLVLAGILAFYILSTAEKPSRKLPRFGRRTFNRRQARF